MSSDDWTISIMLSDRYDYTKPCLFINAGLSQVIILLNNLLPMVNWFFIIERFVISIAIAFAFYLIVYVDKKYLFSIAITAMILLALPGALIEGNFTYIAALSSTVGEIGLYLLWVKDRLRIGISAESVSCLCLIVFGFMLRLQAFFLTVPFFLILIGAKIFDWSKSKEMTKKRLIAIARNLVALVLICTILSFYDSMIWKQSELYSWSEYNTARSALSDYPVPQYSEVAQQLNDIGVSENDWWLATHWTTADPEIFSTERMEAIVEIQKNVVDPISFVEYIKRFIGKPDFLAFLCATLAIAYFLLVTRLERVVLVCAVLVSFAICIFFNSQGRLPLRVEEPVWMLAIVVACIFGCSNALRNSSHQRILVQRIRKGISVVIGVIPIVIVCGWLIFSISVFRGEQFTELFDQEAFNPDNSFMKYAAVNQLDIYWWDTSSMKKYQQMYSCKYLPDSESLARNFKLGGWTTDSPQTNIAKDKVNAEAGIGSLLTNPNARYVSTSKSNISDRLLVFLQEHYAQSAHIELVDEINDEVSQETFSVWKFTTI